MLQHVKCGRLCPRDAKTSGIANDRRRIRGLRLPQYDSNVQSISLQSHVNHHICQNGRSPRKEVPHPCWCVSNALLSQPFTATIETCVQQLLTLFAIARPMAPFYVAGSSIPHTHFARLRNIRILILAQAPSSSTASTRLPLLSPTVSFARSSPPFNAICRLRCIQHWCYKKIRESRWLTSYTTNSRRVPQRPPQPQQEHCQARPLNILV